MLSVPMPATRCPADVGLWNSRFSQELFRPLEMPQPLSGPSILTHLMEHYLWPMCAVIPTYMRKHRLANYVLIVSSPSPAVV